MKDIKFKKKNDLSRTAVAVICVIICAVAVAVIFLMAKTAAERKEKNNPSAGYSFETKGFESVSSAASLNEAMLVFTDSQSGKQGIMTLGGEITENAEHNKFSVCSDVWRNTRYIVESPRSEYLLLVDAETKTVTSRQYHGLTEPEMIPCWSEAGKHLAWTDEKGYAGEIDTTDLRLDAGLYPVATSLGAGAKWGYINSVLRLEIAAVYENAMDYSEDMAAVKKDGKWGYINNLGVTAIPFEFDSCALADAMGRDCAFSFRNGLAPVCKGGKYGIINAKGETVVDFAFDVINQGENGKYVALKDGNWGVITISEELLRESATTTTAQNINSAPAIAQGDYMVRTSGSVLNLRSASDANSSVVAKIPNGTVLTVTKAVSGWAYVKYNSLYGWVSSGFLVKAPETTTDLQIENPN